MAQLQNLFPGFTTTATSAGTVTLTVASTTTQVFTGSTAGQFVTLPTTGVPAGARWTINNDSTVTITVQSSGANQVVVLPPGADANIIALVATPTTAAHWDPEYIGIPIPSAPTTITTGSATSTTVDTKMAALQIPPASVAAGSAFKVKVFGSQTVATGTLTFRIHCGTANTTVDTVIATATPTALVGSGASFDGLLTFRSVGATGTCIAAGTGVGAAAGTSTFTAASVLTSAVFNAALTAFSTQLASVSTNTAASATTFNTTSTASPLFVSVSVSASGGTFTAQQAYIGWAEA